jgi:hypothetical protein
MQWEWINVKNVKLRNSVINITNKLKNGEWKLIIEKKGGDEIKLEFMPDLFVGSEINSVTIDGKPIGFNVIQHEQAVQLKSEFAITSAHEVIVKYKPSVEIYLLENTTAIGAVNDGLKIISKSFADNKLFLDVEGKPGREYKLGVINENLIKIITGAREENGKLIIQIPGEGNNFVKHQIVIEKIN